MIQGNNKPYQMKRIKSNSRSMELILHNLYPTFENACDDINPRRLYVQTIILSAQISEFF